MYVEVLINHFAFIFPFMLKNKAECLQYQSRKNAWQMILVNRQISKAGIYQGISLLWSLGRCLHFFGLMDYYSQPCKFCFYLLFLSFILLFWKYNNLNLCQCTMHIKYPFNWLGHHKYSINIETLPHNLVVFSILKSFSEEIIDKGNSYQRKHSSCILSYSFRGLIILSSWWGAWWQTDTQWCCSSSWELHPYLKAAGKEQDIHWDW